MSSEPISKVSTYNVSAKRWFDLEAVEAFTSILFAVVAWLMAYGRWVLTADDFGNRHADGWVLFGLLFAAAMTPRGIRGSLRLYQRSFRLANFGGWTLRLEEQQLVFAGPNKKQTTLLRNRILGVTEDSHWAKRAGRNGMVLVSPDLPGGTLLIEGLAPTSGVVAEAIMRWANPFEWSTTDAAETSQLESSIYDAAVAGTLPRNGIVIRSRMGWLEDGPWLSVAAATLLGVFGLVANYVLPALGLLAFAGIITAVFLVFAFRAVEPQKGLLGVFREEAFLFRTKAGVQKLAFANIARVELDERRRFHPVFGLLRFRLLKLTKTDSTHITLDERAMQSAIDGLYVAFEEYRAHAHLDSPPTEQSDSQNAS